VTILLPTRARNGANITHFWPLLQGSLVTSNNPCLTYTFLQHLMLHCPWRCLRVSVSKSSKSHRDIFIFLMLKLFTLALLKPKVLWHMIVTTRILFFLLPGSLVCLVTIQCRASSAYTLKCPAICSFAHARSTQHQKLAQGRMQRPGQMKSFLLTFSRYAY
jgi:hypothetical protein